MTDNEEEALAQIIMEKTMILSVLMCDLSNHTLKSLSDKDAVVWRKFATIITELLDDRDMLLGR